jgi:putative endonuclease
MKHYVYILYSPSKNQYYRGITNNIFRRFAEHNKAQELATKAGVPWFLAWYTTKPNRSEAMILEKKLKNIGSHRRLLDFIAKHTGGLDEQLCCCRDPALPPRFVDSRINVGMKK